MVLIAVGCKIMPRNVVTLLAVLQIKAGDKLLRVGDVDIIGKAVADMRHLIIGEIGSRCQITLRSATIGQVRRWCNRRAMS